MTTAAPAAAAAPETGAEGGQEEGAPAQRAAPVAPPQPRKLKLKGIDGPDVEREYDEAELVGLAQRGKQTARILSKAEERAQAAARKEAEYEAKLAKIKSGDVKAQRAYLKEMGVDVRKLAEAEVEEYFTEKELTTEQKRIRELEAKEAEWQAKDADAKKKADKEAEEAEQARHEDELSNLFLEVMQLARLPKTSSRPAFMRIASLYQSASETGVELTPELAAERVKGALKAEQKALFYKESVDPRTDQKTQVLDMDAMEEWFSEEDWKAINRRAVEKFRQRRAGGPPPAVQRQGTTQEQPPPSSKGAGRKNFWKELDTRIK